MNNFSKFPLILIFFSLSLLNSCGGKLPGADARKYPADPKLRVAKNLEDGRGINIMDIGKNKNAGGGVFEFASSNSLWKASLDVIDFMPLSSVNYSGGIIITDWYSDNKTNESIKISIRFLTNEIRADAVDIKVFNRKCSIDLLNCKTIQTDGVIVLELKRKILKLAAVYEEDKIKNKK